MQLRPIIAALALGLTLGGCANQVTLSETVIMQTFPAVAELKQALDVSDKDEVDLLSPLTFAQARQSYDKSLQWAAANHPDAEKYAGEGLMTLRKAQSITVSSRDIFEEVINARGKALAVGSDTYRKKEFEAAELAFKDLTGMLEQGRLDSAKAGRADVIALYSALELQTLKDSTIDQAQLAIDEAKRAGAEAYAPKTYALALEEVGLAQSVLDADRTSREKAARHAQQAQYHARRATEITDIIKNYRNSDFSYEDIVLWYQDQLSRAVVQVEPNVRYDQPNKQVINGLATSMGAAGPEVAMLQAQLKQAEEQIAALTLEKDSIMNSARARTDQDKAIADKFARIQSMFTSAEAEVYRQADNVLIRAHGFRFPSGRSEIQSDNFAMLTKIIKAIEEFPNARILISGHTDTVGDALTNKNLSIDRADKVARFIIDVGGVNGDRVTSTGYGKERPVANNETPEGRAANRRVEVLIDNSYGL